MSEVEITTDGSCLGNSNTFPLLGSGTGFAVPRGTNRQL